MFADDLVLRAVQSIMAENNCVYGLSEDRVGSECNKK